MAAGEALPGGRVGLLRLPLAAGGVAPLLAAAGAGAGAGWAPRLEAVGAVAAEGRLGRRGGLRRLLLAEGGVGPLPAAAGAAAEISWSLRLGEGEAAAVPLRLLGQLGPLQGWGLGVRLGVADS